MSEHVSKVIKHMRFNTVQEKELRTHHPVLTSIKLEMSYTILAAVMFILQVIALYRTKHVFMRLDTIRNGLILQGKEFSDLASKMFTIHI